MYRFLFTHMPRLTKHTHPTMIIVWSYYDHGHFMMMMIMPRYYHDDHVSYYDHNVSYYEYNVISIVRPNIKLWYGSNRNVPFIKKIQEYERSRKILPEDYIRKAKNLYFIAKEPYEFKVSKNYG